MKNNIKLTEKITLISGNMFLSPLQTVTITVNCVGVMGKGIALIAKNLFPDVYTHYRNICKNGQMKMGKPVLYDEKISQLYVANEEYKSVLLFPTKDHWKQKSDILGIEQGLFWLVENYEKLGIKSLAIPALGCGNGGLDWKYVGPILYRHLSKMNIPIHLYLPERMVPEKYLTLEYLSEKLSKITDYGQ
jgi:O-acetyl-ADP-ribose deacetylase (regulator of RNase III)